MNSCFSMCNYILVNISKHNDEKKILKKCDVTISSNVQDRIKHTRIIMIIYVIEMKFKNQDHL